MKHKLVRVAMTAALAAALTFVAVAPASGGNGEFLTITKAAGQNVPAGASFVINVTCTGTGGFTGTDIDQDLNFTAAGGSQNVSMPSGYEADCVITETTTSGATPTYACESAQSGAATCGGGGAAPATVEVNDPSSGLVATITVTNDFAAAATPAVAAPTTTG